MIGGAAFAVSAPAKVNLVLRVGPTDADGYHHVFSIVQQISLVDRLRVFPRRRGVRFACDASSVPSGRANLVVQAAERLQRAAGVACGATVELEKRIPVGAGLGGGSSDAAAVVLALNRLWGLGWSRRRLSAAIAPLGSDIALFFTDPLAVVEGQGEQARPLSDTSVSSPVTIPWVFVVVYPGMATSTAWAYRSLDRWRHARRRRSTLTGPPRPFPLTVREREIIISRFQRIIRTPTPGPVLQNDFQETIQAARPVLREVDGLLTRSGAAGVLMSGSGSAVFGLFATLRSAQQAAEGLRRMKPGWGVWVARPLRQCPAVRAIPVETR